MDQTININDIKISTNRIRREFNSEAIGHLAESIRKKGLLHPIVLQKDKQTLIAGERRTKAIRLLYDLKIPFSFNGKEIPLFEIPFIVVTDLNKDDLLETELEENVLRKDLTYQEHAQAIAQLHLLRVKQNTTQTLIDTAREIEGDVVTSQGTKIKEALLIAANLEDPQVASASTKKEALKIIKKKQNALISEQLANQFDLNKTPHKFYHGDFLQGLPDTESVDVILTDPPYGIDANNFGDQAGNTHEYEDSFEYFKDIISDFARESARVGKTESHAYVFCDIRNFNFIRESMERHGWYVWETPIIWAKSNGMLPRPEHAPRRTYETILYAIRGNKRVRSVFPDVISIATLQSPAFGAEKPVEVYENILSRSVQPGDHVWDPFAGAGPIFPAANKFSVRVTASEKLTEKYNYAKLRMMDGFIP